jgi:hypothetical protein
MEGGEYTLRSALRRVRRRWFLLEWSRVFAWGMLAAAAAICAAATIQRLADLRGTPLVLLTLGAAALPAALLSAIAWPLRRRPGDRQVARYIEERCPELEDRVASATALLHNRTRAAFEELVLAEAARRVDALDLDRIVDRVTLKRRGLAAGAAMLALLAAAVGFRDAIGQAWVTTRYAFFPPNLRLEVQPGDIRVIEGQSIRVRAVVTGLPPGWSLVPPPAIRIESGASVRRLDMEPTGGRFETDLGGIRRTTTYRVESGSLVSRDYRVTVRRLPRVTRIDLDYTYPSFSGLAPRTEEDGGDIFAPAGTKVRLHVRTAEAVHGGTVKLAAGSEVALRPTGARELTGELTVDAEGSYRVALNDLEGLQSAGDTEYFIRIMDDRPPEVRIVRPAGDRRVTRLEEVGFEARADDDYGVNRLELVVSTRGEKDRVIPLHRGTPATSVAGSYTLFLEELDVQPGDFVSYYARARDVGRGKRPTEARSDIFFLEVRPFTEEFEAAQSQAFMAGGGSSFDDLASQQKDVIIATWKLERRANAGRSRNDIAAVARAQGEVRKRAQAMSMRAGRPRPPQSGAAPTPAEPGPSPLESAVEAMGMAQRALEALNTGGAIPHEMDALNQLLRAQAENTRRQIARQRSGGGRGGQTGNQDLSALFDRELQRQQDTNYESRSTAEQKASSSEGDPLEKLRELARRQDDLSRRNQELARQRELLSPEEAKRQLERLTREQEEMQRQAQQLARQMSQQGGQESDNRRDNTPRDAGQSVQRAAEEMGRAANDMQQGNAGAAQGRGSRALDRLRDAERRVASNQPDERQRTAGDLQLELQQMAEAERRVAREAAGGEPSGDTLRQLAGEQGRIADQMDRVTETVREMSAGAPEGDPARQAARALDRERLTERLRGSARELRDAADRERGPGAEDRGRLAQNARALADAMDRAASGFGSASGRDASATKLSERLARARELRKQLEELERRIEQQRGRQAGQRQGGDRQRSSQEDANRGELASADARTPRQRSGESQGQQPGQAAGQGEGRSTDSGELARLQQEFSRRLREAQDTLSEARGDLPDVAQGFSTPEQWEPSRSAPGTEAFKQDFARWDVLRRDVSLALERVEAALAAQLNERSARDRLAADADDRAPEAYRRQIARYYETITKKERQ